MLLLPIILCLVICAVLYGIAYDVQVFIYKTEQAYDYAKETVPEYLEHEKEFIYEKFLPEIAGWEVQHQQFSTIVNKMFMVTLIVAMGTLIMAAGTDPRPGFLLVVEAVDSAIIGTYFSFFRPRKKWLYSKMDQFDAEIRDMQQAAN